MKAVNQATGIGFSSILIWASLLAVIKLITESLSPVSAIVRFIVLVRWLF
jgi:hypothetical protein